jgi:pimeloyl-ACP methyl ester carboxylesterase
MAQTDPPRALGALPLRVLTRGVADDGTHLSPEEQAWEETWLSFQSELASLSTNSRHQVVAGASHFIHWDKPEVIVSAIEGLLETEE